MSLLLLVNNNDELNDRILLTNVYEGSTTLVKRDLLFSSITKYKNYVQKQEIKKSAIGQTLLE